MIQDISYMNTKYEVIFYFLKLSGFIHHVWKICTEFIKEIIIMAELSEHIQTADWKSEKHVPVIECPDKVKAGEIFQVKVTLGKEVSSHEQNRISHSLDQPLLPRRRWEIFPSGSPCRFYCSRWICRRTRQRASPYASWSNNELENS